MQKIFAVTLVFILAISILTACDSSGKTPSGSNNDYDGLTLSALKKAVQDLGYETSDQYLFGVFSTIEPQNGFTVYFRTETASFDFAFFEFKDNAEALAYKKQNDAPKKMNPLEHVVYGRFAAERLKIGGGNDETLLHKLIDDAFKKASSS